MWKQRIPQLASLRVQRHFATLSSIPNRVSISNHNLIRVNSVPQNINSIRYLNKESPIENHEFNDNIDLSYASYESKSGSKSLPLVILHSLMGRKNNWKIVAKEINHLLKNQVVSVDARNHGESPHTTDMNYPLLAKDIEQFAKEMKLEKINFLGHSMGGRVGMILALTQPHLIDKLICVDSTPVNSISSIDTWKSQIQACKKLKEIEPELKKLVGINRAIAADKAIKEILISQHDRSVFLTNLLFTTKDKSDKNLPLWRVNIDSVIANPMFTASFPDFENVSFNGKTLFICGSNSKFYLPEHEEEIYRLFPNAKIVVIPEAGHWLHTEKHKEFMENVIKFLDG